MERITFQNSRVSHPVLLDGRTLAYLASGPDETGPWLYGMDLEQCVPHRISFGLERYTSLAASAGGTRLLATVTQSHSSIWNTPLADDAGAGEARPNEFLSLVAATGLSPRTGPDYILYVAERAGRLGIWKAMDGQSRELWRAVHSNIVGAPAITADGRRIAFTVADGEPRLMSIHLDDRPPSPLVSEYSIDPVWSPDGQYLIYSGADVGTTFPVRAVAKDGRPYPIPALILSRGSRRVAFRPGSDSAILFERTQESSRIALIEQGG